MTRFRIIIGLFLIAFFILLIRLFYLQVYSFDELGAAADSQEFYEVDLAETPRGAIYDRNGVSITSSEHSLSLLIVPFLVDDTETMAKKVCDIFPLSEEQIISKSEGVRESGETIRKQPFIARTGLSEDDYHSIADFAITRWKNMR